MNSLSETPEPAEETVVRPDPRNVVDPRRSRFLFVDIAAQRAKQLRRGARLRIDLPEADPNAPPAGPPRKAERLAMDEVRLGYVEYALPHHAHPLPETETDS